MKHRFLWRFFRRSGNHPEYPFQLRMFTTDPWPWYSASRMMKGRSEIKDVFQGFINSVREYEEKPPTGEGFS